MKKTNLLALRKKENIVILSYRPESDRIKFDSLEAIRDESLRVDLERDTWAYKGWENLKIGTNRPIAVNERSGIIGVYDKTNLTHREAWAHAALDAIRDLNSASEA